MLKIFTKKEELKNYRDQIIGSVGLIPTMGNLHEGHLSLLKTSLDQNDNSIITIFVNKTQFGPHEDFDKYPRTFDEDLTKIESIVIGKNKEVIVFHPETADEIYPPGFQTSISIGPLKEILCGQFRPTHFDGVTTVVYKLFTLSRPTRAYFGQKDYQQCIIIKKMIDDLEIPLEMHILPIIRSVSGLALSSRNQYLSSKELNEGLHLIKTLKKCEQLLLQKENYQTFIQKELSQHSEWDYLEIRDGDTLLTLLPTSKKAVILGAFRLGKTRLLDNIVVNLC